MEMVAILLVVAAARGLWEQTKRDLNQWRHRPPPPRSGGMLRRALRRLTAGGTGYWGHQAAHGFPTARAGLHDGWNRAREAHHQARRTIAQNRAEHVEGLAELRPELENLRERRRRALGELEEQRRRRWQEQQQAAERERERAEAEPAADPPEPEDPPEVPAEASDLPEEDEKPEDPLPEEETPGPDTGRGETTKGTTMGETSYARVKAHMRQTITDAEQRQAEAQQAVEATEEHLSWTMTAKGEASTMADEMQALEVDGKTLGAMSEHLDALGAAEKNAFELRDQAVLNKQAWDQVLESAQQVLTVLEASGHGNLAEAHADAEGGGAEKSFYEPE